MYADVLFLIDFSMDTVTLWLTARIIHARVKTWRVALAAAIGAAISTVITALMVSGTSFTVLGIFASLLIVLTTFDFDGIVVLLKNTSLVWTVGMLIGGVMTALTSFGTSVDFTLHASNNGRPSVALLPIGILVCVYLIFTWSRVPRQRSVTVNVVMNDKNTEIRGMVDTGNLLRDPISACPVLITSEKALLQIL